MVASSSQNGSEIVGAGQITLDPSPGSDAATFGGLNKTCMVHGKLLVLFIDSAKKIMVAKLKS